MDHPGYILQELRAHFFSWSHHLCRCTFATVTFEDRPKEGFAVVFSWELKDGSNTVYKHEYTRATCFDLTRPPTAQCLMKQPCQILQELLQEVLVLRMR